MLDIIRNLVSSIFGKILLGLMVLSFALWGVGDILNSSNTQLAAKVGKQKITLDEFYYEFQRSLDDFNKSLDQKITLAEAYKQNIHSLVINEMIYNKMISEFADNNNIYISNDVLIDVIKSMTQFQNEDGSFNKTIYDYTIQSTFPSEKIFLESVKILYLKAHIFDLFDSKELLNKKINNLILDYETETRDFEFFTINNIPFDEPSFTDEELKKFYSENNEKYRNPKSIKVNLLEINFNDFINEIDLDKSVIFENYENNISTYTTPETREIRFSRFNSIKEAEDFRRILTQSSEIEIIKYIDENNISYNTIKKLLFSDFDKNLSDQIFNLQIDEISNPINADELGYYIVKIDDIKKENIISFSEASKEIEEKLIQNEAYDLFDKSVNIANDLHNSGFSISEIGNEINVEVQENINLTDIIKEITDNNFLMEVSNEEVGYQSDIYLDDIKALILEISEIQETFIPKFEKIKSNVKKDLIQMSKEKFLDNLLTSIVLEIKPDGADGFYKYAYSNSADLKKVNKVRRSNLIKEIDPDTQKKLFKIEKNNILRFENNGQFGILLLTKINNKNKDNEDQKLIEKIQENINNNFNSTATKTLEKQIINNIEYQIFTQNINNLFQ